MTKTVEELDIEPVESENLEVAEEVVDDQVKADDQEPQEATEENEEDDGVIVSIGEDAPPQEDEQANAPSWVKELRKTNREIQKENRELKERLKVTTTTENKPVALGKKPTLSDFDFDEDRFESALDGWYKQKRQVEEQQAAAKAEADAATEAWNQKLLTYSESRDKLKVKDFDDAEETIKETFSQTQQGILMQGSENAALLVYALGKNPAKAKELAAIKDPVKYAFAVAKLETQLKVTQRKAPPPEKSIAPGSASISGAVDSTLDKLRAESIRTGDSSKVFAYKRQKALANK